ncbi:MAG: Rieske (2Fe-2S) protein, partial [Persicimonas sp.]
MVRLIVRTLFLVLLAFLLAACGDRDQSYGDARAPDSAGGSEDDGGSDDDVGSADAGGSEDDSSTEEG